jgi:hypothetical protein
MRFQIQFLTYSTFFIFIKIHLSIFSNDRQIRSLIYKVKSIIQNPLFYLNKLEKQIKIHLYYNF